MKFSESSIIAIFIGLFGIIGGVINKGWGLGFWTVNNDKWSNDTKKFISILLGSIALFIGLCLLYKLNRY
jgi:hypothetical protein